MDEGDAEVWAACFTRDGVFHALVAGLNPTGSRELADFARHARVEFGESHHLTTNEIITVDGDTATQKCSLQFFAEKNGMVRGDICVCHDVLRREDGAWRLADRDVQRKRTFTEHAVR